MKKHYILLGVVLLLLAGVAVLAVNKYQHRSTKPSYNQVVTQRDQALLSLKAAQNVSNNDSTAINNLKGQVNTYSSQQAILCAQIKAARLVQPICAK